jgi:alkylation response protein AidB-like acyl-CoA dehydrogenase
VTESQSGSDVAGIRTRARRVAGGYRISGSKIWCTGAPVADFIFVGAKTGEDDSRGSINLFAIERGSKGLEIGRHEDKLGARGVPSCPLSRPIHGARGVGLAQGAIDHALEFVQNRQAFGQTVGEFQGIRWMLADMAMQTEAARSLVYRAAAMVDSGATGRELAAYAAMAKCFATDVAMKVTTDGVQLFGAAGISAEFPINRYMRDAKVLQIVEGTNQIQRNIIGNSLLGRARR